MTRTSQLLHLTAVTTAWQAMPVWQQSQPKPGFKTSQNPSHWGARLHPGATSGIALTIAIEIHSAALYQETAPTATAARDLRQPRDVRESAAGACRASLTCGSSGSALPARRGSEDPPDPSCRGRPHLTPEHLAQSSSHAVVAAIVLLSRGSSLLNLRSPGSYGRHFGRVRWPRCGSGHVTSQTAADPHR